MSSVISVIIVLVVLLIPVFLQLTPGVFAIFYHHELGKKSRKVADDLSLHFYLGVEILNAIIFLSLYFLFSILLLFANAADLIFWILAGICLALAFLVFFLYYRKSGTELFLSRRLARKLTAHAESVKTRTDAFALGALTGTLELWLTLPLYLLSILIVILSPATSSFLIIIFYILATLLPLFITHLYFRSRHLADFMRLRVKIKPSIRAFLAGVYLLLALLIILNGTL